MLGKAKNTIVYSMLFFYPPMGPWPENLLWGKKGTTKIVDL